MEKFEIHTSVITKIVKNENEAMATAKKLSMRYGRATVWSEHDKLATFQNGWKK